MEPVHDKSGERHPLAGESFGEVGSLADGVWFGCRHDKEGRLVGLQEPVRGFGALPEAAEDGVQGGNERLNVGEELCAEDLVLYELNAWPKRWTTASSGVSGAA